MMTVKREKTDLISLLAFRQNKIDVRQEKAASSSFTNLLKFNELECSSNEAVKKRMGCGAQDRKNVLL